MLGLEHRCPQTGQNLSQVKDLILCRLGGKQISQSGKSVIQRLTIFGCNSTIRKKQPPNLPVSLGVHSYPHSCVLSSGYV